jgi:hypothetical protein
MTCLQRTETYLKEIQRVHTPDLQLLVAIMPNPRDDR